MPFMLYQRSNGVTSNGVANDEPTRANGASSPPSSKHVQLWVIANPTSGQGRGKQVIEDLLLTLREELGIGSGVHVITASALLEPSSANGSVGPECTTSVGSSNGHRSSRLHVRSPSEGLRRLHFRLARHPSRLEALFRGGAVRATVVLTEKAGDGMRVAQHIAQLSVTERLSASAGLETGGTRGAFPITATAPTSPTEADLEETLHIVMAIGGDGTLSEVVNGVCRGTLHAYRTCVTTPNAAAKVRNDGTIKQKISTLPNGCATPQHAAPAEAASLYDDNEGIFASAARANAAAAATSTSTLSPPLLTDTEASRDAETMSEVYYWDVLRDRSVLHHLAPLFLYVPGGTGADFAKLKICCRTMDEMTQVLTGVVETFIFASKSSKASSPTTSVSGAGDGDVGDAVGTGNDSYVAYEVDVGRVSFPRTGHTRFFINECSIGMSCDVVIRGEQLKRNRLMSALGGLVLFATSAAISLVLMTPTRIRMARLAPMPTPPSLQPFASAASAGSTTNTAGRETTATRHTVRRRYDGALPAHHSHSSRAVMQSLQEDLLWMQHLRQRARAAVKASCGSTASASTKPGSTPHPSQAVHDASVDLPSSSSPLGSSDAMPLSIDLAALHRQDYYTYSYAAPFPVGGSTPSSSPPSPSPPRNTSPSVSSTAVKVPTTVSPAPVCNDRGEQPVESSSSAASSGSPLNGRVVTPFYAPPPSTAQVPCPEEEEGEGRDGSAAIMHSANMPNGRRKDAQLINGYVVCDDPAWVRAELDIDPMEGPILHPDLQSSSSSPCSLTPLPTTTTTTAHRLLRWVCYASSTICFGNGRWYGGGMHVTPHANPTDGLLSCTNWVATFLPFVSGALSLYTGRHVRWNSTAAFDGERFIVDMDPNAPVKHKAQLLYHSDGSERREVAVRMMEADGELLEELPAVVELGGQLTFIAPRPCRFGQPAPDTTRERWEATATDARAALMATYVHSPSSNANAAAAVHHDDPFGSETCNVVVSPNSAQSLVHPNGENQSWELREAVPHRHGGGTGGDDGYDHHSQAASPSTSNGIPGGAALTAPPSPSSAPSMGSRLAHVQRYIANSLLWRPLQAAKRWWKHGDPTRRRGPHAVGAPAAIGGDGAGGFVLRGSVSAHPMAASTAAAAASVAAGEHITSSFATLGGCMGEDDQDEKLA